MALLWQDCFHQPCHYGIHAFKCCSFILQIFGLGDCDIEISLGRKRRQVNSEELLPQEAYAAAGKLVDSGVFQYGT